MTLSQLLNITLLLALLTLATATIHGMQSWEVAETDNNQ